jgi:hypothetical protein
VCVSVQRNVSTAKNYELPLERHFMHIGIHLSITDTHTKSVKCLAFECRGDKSILGSWDDKIMLLV